MSRRGIEYQPVLDGVRAVAVAVVLLFHGGVAGFSGGYLGVSVFFTLSGFLITSLLIAEHGRTGNVSASGFYARRAKRLLPASIVCMAAIVVVRQTTNWFDAVSTLRRDLLGAALQVSNWVFLAGSGSYQDLLKRSAGVASPLEHYWSLSIEEQFYWVWPLAFLGLCKLARTPARRTAVVVAVTACLAAAAPLIAWRWGPDAAYWATPARASEILVGVLAAFVVARWKPTAAWRWMVPVAFLALAIAVVTFPAAGGPAYHGGLPLIGLASALLIVGLQVPGPGVVALSLSPLVWLGRISYGVYLFHWPVFVIVSRPRVDLDGVWLLALRVAITLAIAQLSFVLVERPIRTASGGRPRWIGAAGVAVTAAVAVLVVGLVPAGAGDYWRTQEASAAAIVTDGSAPPEPLTALTPVPPTSLPPMTVAAAATTDATPATTDGAPTTTDPSPTTTAGVPQLSRPVRILVAGDSTAEATGNGLALWALGQPQLAQVSLDVEKGCGFLRGGDRLLDRWQSVPARCGRWLDRTLPQQVSTLRPDVVVLMTTSWDVLDHRWDGGSATTPFDASFTARLGSDFRAITSAVLDAGAGRVVWIDEPVPNPLWMSLGQTQEDPARHDVLASTMQAIATADPRVSVVDLRGWLDEQGLADDHDLRPDGIHWSPEASVRVATDYLGGSLVRAAVAQSPLQ